MSIDSVNKRVHGDRPHDAVDGNNPVKIGGKSYDPKPDGEGEQAPASVSADGDRVDLMLDEKGRFCERAYTKYIEDDTFAALDIKTATTTNGETVDCDAYRVGSVYLDLSKTGAPGTIAVHVECSHDRTPTWFRKHYMWFPAWVYDDLAVGTGLIEAVGPFPICCAQIRLAVTTTDCDGAKWFTITAHWCFGN